MGARPAAAVRPVLRQCTLAAVGVGSPPRKRASSGRPHARWRIESAQTMQTPIVAIVGPSASGKTTLLKDLVRLGFREIISFTTRAPRSGEVDGRDYHFRSRSWVEGRLAAQGIAEINEFGGELYGFTLEAMDQALVDETPAVKIVDPNGLMTLRRIAPPHAQVTSVFLNPTRDQVLERLAQRHDQEAGLGLEAYAARVQVYHQNEAKWLERHGHRFDVVVPAYSRETQDATLGGILARVPAPLRMLPPSMPSAAPSVSM